MNSYDDLFRAELADRRERLRTQLAEPRARRRLSIRRLLAQRTAARRMPAGRTLAHADLEQRA